MSGSFATINGNNLTNGTYGTTSDIHSRRATHYDDTVKRTLGDVIMSAVDSASQNAPKRSVNTKLDIAETGAIRPPAVEKIELGMLQIDESYDDDCDPYNSTGQFLADAIKAKYDE